MTEYRPASTVGRDYYPVDIFPADVVGGPLALSDDTATTYVDYGPVQPSSGARGGYLRAGSDSYFDDPAEAVASVEVRVLIELMVFNVQNDVQVFVNNTANTRQAFNVPSLWGTNDEPPTGEPRWISTGLIAADMLDTTHVQVGDFDVFAEPFYVGINNQFGPHAAAGSPDFRIYELVLVVNAGARRAPMCRRFPETAAVRGARIHPRTRTLQQTPRRGPGTTY